MMGMTLLQVVEEGIDLGLVMSGLFQIISIKKSVEDPVSSVTLIAYGTRLKCGEVKDNLVQHIIPLVKIDWKKCDKIHNCP